MARVAEIKRKTKETDIVVCLNVDGEGTAKLDYPIGFMAHMLNAFALHGLFDIEIRARGDLDVDQHHLVEDTGIALGEAFARALGGKQGIRRAAFCLYPMDETLARAACDISGRAYLVFNAGLSGIPLISADSGGGSRPFQTDTIADFWQGFCSSCACALHIDILRGRSDHHKIEALFKASARAFREACEIDPRAAGRIPSTKGVLGESGIMVC
ncbi:MAG: imidazoleglycerol-phosphate dehydratase [Spirochaetaceae bacterium]|jgi:imidazoleglycerol-phosphate dehydratase|nr:imidazoleglycerol-phosphate dehydratase [Spirochaetaceae bacterium]